MNESVLLSIQPNWCEPIAKLVKTIEVRKTKPKIPTPFKCYIYCTKAKSHYAVGHIGLSDDELYKLSDGQIKYGSSIELMLHDDYTVDNFLNGKVIGEFICNEIEKYTADDDFSYGIYDVDDDTIYKTCLENGVLWDYGKGKTLYGWHISELVIYDTPKELSDFEKPCPYDEKCAKCKYNDNGTYYEPYSSCNNESLFLSRPPQSWCYVKERERN